MIQRAFFSSLILLLASVPAFAQGSSHAATQSGTAAVAAASIPAIPKDPNKLMLLAAQVNGLSSMGTHPWHVMADFQTFDPDGKPKDKGTFEEWWAGPEKYKVSYKSSGFNQVLYHEGGKSLVTGDTGMASLPEHIVEEYLVRPLPVESEITKKNYTNSDRKIAKFKLRCVQPAKPIQPNNSPLFIGQSDDYCFDPDIPAIRVENFEGGLSVLFNKVVSAGGHYVAEQTTARNSNLPIVKMNVTALEFPSHIENSLFEPPQSAVPAPALWSEPGITGGKKIGGDDPHYPLIAKMQRNQGQVILSARINKAGEIDDLQVISGPIALRKASLDAVKTWKFKPFFLNGKPVEVETQINVTYRMLF